MKTLTWILLAYLGLTLGGIQLLIEGGQQIAHSRAIRFQKMRENSEQILTSMEFDAAVFDGFELMDVGHGVIEFVYNGERYDAFEITRVNGKVIALAKKDVLDTWLMAVYKQSKRLIAHHSVKIDYQLFNFYFPWETPDLSFRSLEQSFEYANWYNAYQSILRFLPAPPP